jgi:hypothetical protein
MAKVEMKTKKNEASVEDFINAVPDEQKREDSAVAIKLMEKLSGDKGKMWGSAIVGFGSRLLKYDSGRELDWMEIGFSPRKANLTFYIGTSYPEYEKLLAKLGKHTTGKGCLYVKRLADIDRKVLADMIKASLKHMRKNPGRAG